MPRVIGIDPGTVSIDLCGLDNGRLFLDRSWPTAEALADPAPFVAELEAAGPLDLVVGPAGYGVPITRVQDITEEALRLAVLAAPGETGGIGGLRNLVRALARTALPVVLTPGVVHLPTVPAHRKVNRVDMGTADKVCAVALAVVDQARRLGRPLSATSFVLLELGGAFTAAVAVAGGRIVDGAGGSAGALGLRGAGALDGEVAFLAGRVSKDMLFRGGVATVAGWGARASAGSSGCWRFAGRVAACSIICTWCRASRPCAGWTGNSHDARAHRRRLHPRVRGIGCAGRIRRARRGWLRRPGPARSGAVGRGGAERWAVQHPRCRRRRARSAGGCGLLRGQFRKPRARRRRARDRACLVGQPARRARGGARPGAAGARARRAGAPRAGRPRHGAGRQRGEGTLARKTAGIGRRRRRGAVAGRRAATRQLSTATGGGHSGVDRVRRGRTPRGAPGGVTRPHGRFGLWRRRLPLLRQ